MVRKSKPSIGGLLTLLAIGILIYFIFFRVHEGFQTKNKEYVFKAGAVPNPNFEIPKTDLTGTITGIDFFIWNPMTKTFEKVTDQSKIDVADTHIRFRVNKLATGQWSNLLRKSGVANPTNAPQFPISESDPRLKDGIQITNLRSTLQNLNSSNVGLTKADPQGNVAKVVVTFA
jgi:hypothetical protein